MSTSVHHRSLVEGTAVQIKAVEQIGAYRLRITFSDAAQSEIDFEPFLRASQHSDIRAFLEPSRFSQFTLKDGEPVWGDYELCFPIADLYEGRI